MYVTATQPKIEYAQHEHALVHDAHRPTPNQAAQLITASFMEQHGSGRLEELIETLDFPLDFQI